MPRYALRFEFDGRDWSGTASQLTSARTLQDHVENALAAIDGGPRRLVTCGRLDAGVSAEVFVVHCDLEQEREPLILGRMLNPHLPHELVVTAVARVADDWHARQASSGKCYRYRLFERSVRHAFDRHLLWIKPLAHPERLQPFAERLLGHQDLAAFACLRGDDSDEHDPRHVITAVEWQSEPRQGGILRSFRISGDGFLYKQVRGIVGALLDVARDRDGSASERFEYNLTAGRGVGRRSGNVAPAHGLVLERVDYDPEPVWVEI